MSQYNLFQFLKNNFPLYKIIQKSFIPLAGDEDQLMLFVDVDVDVDHWQQCRVEWSVTAATSRPYAQVIEAFSLCMFLFCPFCQTLPSGPPCSKQQGHWLQARHKIQCL